MPMTYTVKTTFIDTAQPQTVYMSGEPYPRAGEKPAPDRAEELEKQGLIEGKKETKTRGDGGKRNGR